MIRSLYFDQEDILDAIQELYCPDGFVCDVTYGNGAFYKNRDKPSLRFDLDETLEDVLTASSTDLPLHDGSLPNVVFDPPFLTYVKKGRESGSIMGKRFSGYWSYDELVEHYKETINEVYRVLQKDGIFVFKCQDIIHNHQLYPTHANVMNWCYEAGLRPLDIFILGAKHRMRVGDAKRKQKHSRSYHCYFLVFKKDNRMRGMVR